ncbi:MAG: hypothetical protein LBS71_01045 [Puniceicoccales bacterium]|jgi:tetratricopeptide (TPR) repeat protein|nr:hypothetical protein [Puniceicoccales bacterium]
MKHLLIYFCFLGSISFANLQGNNAFYEANEAYSEQNYTKAIELLEAIPTHSFGKYFNLGCAYLSNQATTKAWIAFEKARQIEPHNKALAPAFQKLALTQQQTKFIPIFQTKFYINIIVLLTFFIFWLGIFLWIRRRMKGNKHRLLIYGYWLCAIILIGLIGWQNHAISNKCVAIKENAEIHVAPSLQANVSEKIPDGTPLIARERHNNFIYVSLGKGKNGWICKDDIQFMVK